MRRLTAFLVNAPITPELCANAVLGNLKGLPSLSFFYLFDRCCNGGPRRLIGGCLTATGALAKTEMQQVLEDWAAAFNTEDAGKVAMHYKSDATLFPPGNDMLQRRQNVAKPDEEIKIRELVASKIRHLSVPQTGSYVMSDASSPRSSRQSEGNLPPGHSWLEIIKRPTLEAFAAAFTKDVVLDASVLPRSIIGATDVRAFFGATRAMFDAIAFKHEVTAGSGTYLEWTAHDHALWKNHGRHRGHRRTPCRRLAARPLLDRVDTVWIEGEIVPDRGYRRVRRFIGPDGIGGAHAA
jgi:hypothetical protein